MEQAIAERAAPLLTDQPDDCLLSVSGLLFHQAFGPAEDFQALAQLVAFASTCKPVRTAVQPCVEAARRASRDLVSDIVSAGDLHNGPAAQAHSQTMGSWRCPLRLRSLLAAAPGVSNAVVDEENGNTALMLACKLGHIEIARWLLVHGADTGLVNRHGQSARDLGGYKSEQGHDVRVEELLNGAATRAGVLGGAMMVAVETGDLDALTELLARPGSDINWVDPQSGRSLLQHACCLSGRAPRRNAARSVRLLLERGADANRADPRYGDTALHTAAHNGLADCMERLLIGGADRTAKNKDGETARDVSRRVQGTADLQAPGNSLAYV